MSAAGLEGTPPKDLAQRIAGITSALDKHQLYGSVTGSIGLPSAVVLSDSDENWGYGANRGNVRFSKGEDGTVKVYGMNPNDYGMGMDVMWFAWEQYRLSPDGKVAIERQGWPNRDMNVRDFLEKNL